MTRSSMVWRDDYESTMASGHNMFGRPQDFRRYTEPHAAASLYTTAADYARFVCAVLNGTGLDNKSLAEMLAPQIEVDADLGVTWSLGFGKQDDGNGPAIWQWGDYGIFRNYILAYTGQKLGVVYLTNSFNGLGIGRDLISATIGGRARGLEHLNYRQYDSPLPVFTWAVQDRGAGTVTELLPGLEAKHPDEFTPEIIGWIGREFNEAGMVEAGIAMLEFNVNENPGSPGPHADLARVYLERGDRDTAKRCYRRALDAATDDDGYNVTAIEWPMAYIDAIENPVDLPADYLATLAGEYETRRFELRDDGLYYARGDAATKEFRKLTAMSRDMFLIEGLVYFRMKFEFDGEGRPVKVVGMYESGYRDQSIRSK
jgi:tetratricopeptide (TPR) repeat protein